MFWLCVCACVCVAAPACLVRRLCAILCATVSELRGLSTRAPVARWAPGRRRAPVHMPASASMADMFGGRPIWAHPNGVFGRRVCQHGRPLWQTSDFGHTLMVCLADASATMEDVFGRRPILAHPTGVLGRRSDLT